MSGDHQLEAASDIARTHLRIVRRSAASSRASGVFSSTAASPLLIPICSRPARTRLAASSSRHETYGKRCTGRQTERGAHEFLPSMPQSVAGQQATLYVRSSGVVARIELVVLQHILGSIDPRRRLLSLSPTFSYPRPRLTIALPRGPLPIRREL